MATRDPIDFTPDGLLAVIEQLDSAAGDLRMVMQAMKDRDLKSLPIVNAKEMRKGLKKIDAFARAAVDAMTDHRTGIEFER